MPVSLAWERHRCQSQNPAVLSLDLQRVDMPTDATGDGFGVIVVDQFLYPGYLPCGYIDHEQDLLVTECIGKLGQMDVTR